MFEFLELERPLDGVTVVSLARPDRRNALSIALRDEVSDVLDSLAADEACRAVVLTGVGPVFCAGFDLHEFTIDDIGFQTRLWASSDRFHRTVLEFPLPLIAAVNGPAVAGGFDLAVMCDVRIAATTATFSHPEITFGDVVYGPLHDAVGGSVARDLCLTGRVVDADEALRLRLVSTVVAPGELLDLAVGRAAMAARAPRAVLVRTKAKMIRRAGVAGGPTLDL